MADIAMCSNQKCTLRNTCYRFTATAKKFRQSYVAFKQVNGECDYYWITEKQKK
jgi:hypothetical protein